MKRSATEFHHRAGRGLLGCLWISILLIAAVVLAIELDRRRAAAQTLGLVREHLSDAIRESRMPEEQKQAAQRQIDRISDRVREAGLDEQEIKQVRQKLSLRPAWGILMLWYADQKLVQDTALSPELKEESTQQLRRLATGAYGENLNAEGLRDVYAPALEVVELLRSGQAVSLEEAAIRFVDAMRSQADASQLPESPWEVDVTDFLHRSRQELENLLQSPADSEPQPPAHPLLKLETEP